MRIVIHGGMHKTGTTAFQQLIVARRQMLASHGVYVPPGRPPVMFQAMNVGRPQWNRSAIDQFGEEAKAAAMHTLLLSGELVSAFSADGMKQLAGSASGLPVKFIFCFRHWNDFLPSRWVQFGLRRDSQTYGEFLNFVSDPAIEHPAFDFSLVLQRALASGAEVEAISYTNAMKGGGIIAALLSAVGIDGQTVKELAGLAPTANTRPDWIEGEVTRLLNGPAAQRLGLPADDLAMAQAQSRQLDRPLVLSRHLHKIDEATLSGLRNAVAQHERTLRTNDLVDISGPDARLQAYSGLFTNLVDGKIFATIPDDKVTVADIDWITFQAQNRELVERALDAMLEQRP